jgi:hypothetical protein
LRSPGLRTLVLASLPVGFCFGSVEVALPAFGVAEGSEALGGVLLAVWAGAGLVAGLAYGAKPLRFQLLDQHLLLACLLPLCCLPMLAASSPGAMAALVVLGGLPVAPLVASRNRLVDRVAPVGTGTEAFTWPLTALVVGISAGAASAGALIEANSWEAGVLAAAVLAAVGAGVVLTRRRTLAPALAA